MSKERNRNFAWTAKQQKIGNPAELLEAKKIAGVKTHQQVYMNFSKKAIYTGDFPLFFKAVDLFFKNREKDLKIKQEKGKD